GPLDLHLSLEVDPRVLLSFEDLVMDLPDDADPPDDFHFPLSFTWALPPLPHGPDLLRLAIDLAGIGGIDLPLDASATDSLASPAHATSAFGSSGTSSGPGGKASTTTPAARATTSAARS